MKCMNRLPTEAELKHWSPCPSSASAKVNFSNHIMDQEEFINRIILILRIELLQGTTYEDLREKIQDYDLLFFLKPADQKHLMPAWQRESKRLYKVYNLERDYLARKITFEDIYITYFDNFIYDELNMGIDNFINSTFSYALGRGPTNVEYNSALKMLNGQYSTLLYKKGDSREDYFRILTSNDNFYEKQVKYWYYFFHFKYPSETLTTAMLNDLYKNKSGLNIKSIIQYLIANKL